MKSTRFQNKNLTTTAMQFHIESECELFSIPPDGTNAQKYVEIIEWSEEDRCYVGSCPGLFNGGCHGDDEQNVFAELCEIVEETIQLFEKEGKDAWSAMVLMLLSKVRDRPRFLIEKLQAW